MFWDEPIDTLLRVFHHELESRLLGHLTSAYLRGSAQMVEWGRTKTTDRPIFYEGPPIVDAMEYARKHCAVMVTKMDEETKRQLARVISEGIENKRGIPGLTRDIKSQFADMTRYRAEMIARTETCDALEQAFMDRAKALGVDGKRWIVTAPCPVCEDLGEVGTVPIDYDYAQDGHEGLDTTRPPAHPNCRCALAPVILGVTEADRARDEGGRFAGTGAVKHKYGTLSAETEARLDTFAEQNARNSYERAAVYGADGAEMLNKAGGDDSVSFTADEVQSMRGAQAMIHNHPSGGSFSDDDLRFAATIDVGHMEVTSGEYRYYLSPGEQGWGDPDAARDAWRQAQMATMEKHTERFNELWPDLIEKDPRMNYLEAQNIAGRMVSVDHTHETMETVSQKLGYYYGRHRR